jgi:hypothetical protein
MRLSGIILAGAALALTTAIPANAGKITPASAKEIRDLLTMIGGIYGPEVGELAAGQVISLPFEGDATVEYYMNVICDDDCENVDLAVSDADGTEIDTDDADDNAPVLNIHASEYRSVLEKPKGISRPMTLEIRMKACKAETCAYGVRISAVD